MEKENIIFAEESKRRRKGRKIIEKGEYIFFGGKKNREAKVF